MFLNRFSPKLPTAEEVRGFLADRRSDEKSPNWSSAWLARIAAGDTIVLPEPYRTSATTFPIRPSVTSFVGTVSALLLSVGNR